MKNYIKEIKKIVKGEVKDDAKTLTEYSHDTSLFEVRPKVVVFPKDSDDIKALVKFTIDNPEISLTARSGGSGMSGGSLNDSIILDFTKHINKIKKVVEDSSSRGASQGGYAILEPGVWYRDFERETLKKNLLMPSFPASREICAIGGMVANNAGGEKTLFYGKTENYVKGLKVILSDGNEYEFSALSLGELEKKKALKTFEGEVYRKMYKLLVGNYGLLKNAKPQVSKNSAGYALWNIWDKERGLFDLTKLFVGSQGTLGIVTEVNFRLIKPKKHSKLLVIFLRDIEPLAQIVNKVLDFGPETFESYDDHTLKLAMRFFPQFVKILKGNLLSLAWEFLPEVSMILTGGFPKFVLTAEFTGDDEGEIDERAKMARESLKEFNVRTRITTSEVEAQKYRVIRRESFNLLRNKIKDKQTAPFIDDIIVRPEKLPQFLPKLKELLDGYDFTYTIAGHMGSGNFHIIPLMNLANPRSKEIIKELAPKVYSLVLEFEGSITAEHNDGLIRSPYLKQMYGPKIYKLFVETKDIFDPKNIFNPGKKVGATIQYALDHIKNK